MSESPSILNINSKYNNFFLLLASLFFSLMTVCVKKIDNRIPIFELVFFRSIFSLIITFIIYGQEKIDFDYTKDYDSILKMSKDKTNKLFYNDLFERFQKADSTLTNYELVTLQIGYTDNPKYYPYQDIGLEREIWSLNEKGEFELAKKKLDTLLSNNPFNILGHREMSYVQYKLGNKKKWVLTL